MPIEAAPEGAPAVRAVTVRAFLPDHQPIEVSTTTGRRGLNCFKGGPAALAAQWAVELLRLSEPQRNTTPLVVFNINNAQGACALANQPLVQTAAVVADHLARGLLGPHEQALVLGQLDLVSEDPGCIGRLHPFEPAVQQACLNALLAAPDAGNALIVLPGDPLLNGDACRAVQQRHPKARVAMVDHLHALRTGHAAPRRVHTAECFFPRIHPNRAELIAVRVSVSPWVPQREFQPAIHCTGPAATSGSTAQGVETLLRHLRTTETPSKQWETVVLFSGDPGDANSYELALAVADRMARGREWRGPGRTFATGCVSPKGVVGNVMGHLNPEAPANLKLEALAQELCGGDTLLLPDTPEWRADAQRYFAQVPPGRMNKDQPCILFCQQVHPPHRASEGHQPR